MDSTDTDTLVSFFTLILSSHLLATNTMDSTGSLLALSLLSSLDIIHSPRFTSHQSCHHVKASRTKEMKCRHSGWGMHHIFGAATQPAERTRRPDLAQRSKLRACPAQPPALPPRVLLPRCGHPGPGADRNHARHVETFHLGDALCFRTSFGSCHVFPTSFAVFPLHVLCVVIALASCCPCPVISLHLPCFLTCTCPAFFRSFEENAKLRHC